MGPLHSTAGMEGPLEGELQELRGISRSLFSGCRTADLHSGVLEATGKLLRPRVLFLCALHAGDLGRTVEWEQARSAALAIELAHVGTLYHDDIVDRSDMRRDVPSIHREWGVRSATVGGTHLLMEANALVAGLDDPVPQWWGKAALDVSAGQIQEMELAGDLSIPVETFVAMVRRKTGALFRLAAKCGAWSGGVSEIGVFAAAGSHMGAAFQLYDDLNDFADESPVARSRSTDLRNRTYSLPIQLAARSGTPQATELRSLLVDDGKPLSQESASRAVVLATEAGGFEQALDVAHTEAQACRDCLERLPDTRSLRALKALVDAFFEPTKLRTIAGGLT